jgi:hypothetical protein
MAEACAVAFGFSGERGAQMGPTEQEAAAEVARLWQSEDAQSEAYYALGRSLEKRGSFSLTYWLTLLATPGALSGAQVIELYTRLRDLTWRNELEWRDQFAAAFPASSGDLPPPWRETVIDYWEQAICNAVLSGNAKLLEKGLDQLIRAGVRLADLGPVDRAAIKEKRWIPAGEGTPSADSLTLSQLAEAVGRPGIADLLRQKP